MKQTIFVFLAMATLLFNSCIFKESKEKRVDNTMDSVAELSIDSLAWPIEVRAKKITLQDGLPSNVVNCMWQDQKGFMWFGTHNGLARYDGNQMLVLLHDSVSSNRHDGRIKKIIEDKTYKKLWIYAASETFYCLNLANNKLEDFCRDGRGKPLNLLPRNLNLTNSRLVEDGLIYLWGKDDGGLIVDYRNGEFDTRYLNRQQMSFALVKLQDKDKLTEKKLLKKWKIPNGKILTDNKGNKWIYNRTGILRKVVGDSLVSLNLLPNQEVNYIDYERFKVVEDNHGLIWVSTYGNGLYVFSHDLKRGQHFVADENGNSPIASNYLLSIVADRNDGVWVSAEYGGVAHVQVMDSHVERIFPNGEGRMDLSNVVRMIKKLHNGDVLVSTRDGSLYRYSADMKQLLYKSRFESNVYSVVESNHGDLWIGTRGKGVFGVEGLDFKDKKVFCMLQDNRERLWIGTFGDGLSVATKAADHRYAVKTFFADSVGLNEVRCMLMDKKHVIWVGTSSGLVRIEPNESFEVYKRGFEIHDMLLDADGKLWLAVSGLGLVCAQENADGQVAFTVYDKQNGLVNDMVQSVVLTGQGDIVVSTQQGISYWHAKRKTFDSYLLDKNPMGNVYNENSAVRLDDGRILLGGNYGLTIVSASKLYHVKGQTNVVFTSSPYSDSIVLSHAENSPKIDFSTLDFSDVNNVKYQTWLEGYEKGWGAATPIASVQYHNLPSGSYTLHVKASYSDGVWGRESLLRIDVEPPFYLSVWAILMYVLIIMTIVVLVVKNMRDKADLKSKIKLEQELTKYKLVFFTNIAHEFRTPLTLIQGSLEKERQIIKKKGWQTELEHTVRTMDKSVKRMLRLINQLLEFRKLQAGKLQLALQETEVVSFARGIYRVFADAAVSKSIQYTFDSSVPKCMMFLDRPKIDKVLYNIISNAFKYTPEQGSIAVSLLVEKGQLRVRVTDTGVGIPEEKRAQLFSRFMQNSYTADSFGIGLHLTHELVLLHHGTISYTPNPGGGSIFEFDLPLDASVYQPTDFLAQDSPVLEKTYTEENPHEEVDGESENTVLDREAEKEMSHNMPLNSKVILLIEDDDDVRDFLARELSECFVVKTASEGLKGIAIAKEEEVDLVVSDVMMPGVNGFEVAKRLRNNFETCHIPIILLTALGTEESMLEGTESGADVYMTKPFSPQLLKARIFQLFDQREKLRQKFTQDQTEIRPSMCATDKDQLFVRRLDAIISARISDVSLSVDVIASQLHIGRTVFYRKVRGITGYTPNDYIRVIRMKKAAELLKEGKMNVSEIAYAVGFDNPNYFSKKFKEQFGVPPSQYE